MTVEVVALSAEGIALLAAEFTADALHDPAPIDGLESAPIHRIFQPTSRKIGWIAIIPT